MQRQHRINEDRTLGSSIKRNKNKKTTLRQREKDLQLQLIKAYPKQVTFEAWLPGTPVKGTTAVTSGAIQFTNSVTSSNISSFATRFGSTFVEYRIIRAKWLIRLFSSTNPGVLQIWVDDKSTSSPTLAEAQERATLVVSASATDKNPVMKWVNSDVGDLLYTATNGSFNAATLKIYSNNANFGSSIVATDYFEVEPLFQVQFRGLQGV